MAPAEKNYGIGEMELLAIVEACKHWRHYIEGAAHQVRVITDHSVSTCLDAFNSTGYEPGSPYTLNIPRKSPVATPNHRNPPEPLNPPKTLVVAMKRDSSPEGRIKQIILVGFEN